MKKIFLSCLMLTVSTFTFSQKKVELFDLVKKLAENKGDDVGEWAVGEPAMYPVKWKEDRVIMSEDTSINFYRTGTADIVIRGVSAAPSTKPANVMLRGPRMGYIAYNILAVYKNNTLVPPPLDSLFGKNNYTLKLLKTCNITTTTGFNYYEVTIPKKNTLFIKMTWKSNVQGTWIMSLDCNDVWANRSVKTTCPVK